MAVWLRARLADGRMFTGPVKAPGGFLGGGCLHVGIHRARIVALRAARAATRRAEEGLPSGVFEPRPGYCAICPNLNAPEGTGREHVEIPLRGTHWTVVLR